MGRHVVDVQTDSAASVEHVWRLLADVRTWVDWSSFDEAGYAKEGVPAPHGVGAERSFRLGPFRSVDTVLAFDPPTHLAYTYAGPLPIDDYRAEVTLTGNGHGTRIRWHGEFSTTIPLSGPVVRALVRKVYRDLSSRLARAAEPAVPVARRPPGETALRGLGGAMLGAAPGLVMVGAAQYLIEGERQLTVGAPGILLAVAGAVLGFGYGLQSGRS